MKCEKNAVFSWEFFSLFPIIVSVQNIQFKHLAGLDGLSHPYVRCMVQDNLGFMWFGTFDGLNKSDGDKFTVYRHLDNGPNSLPLNTIVTLYKDLHANLLIGTSEGFCVYDYHRDVFVMYSEAGGFKLDNIL